MKFIFPFLAKKVLLLKKLNIEMETPKLEVEWKKFVNYIGEHYPHVMKRLNPPASIEEINELEELVELELPNDFKTLYQINNGEDESFIDGAFFIGYRMLTISQIKQKFLKNKEIGTSEWTVTFGVYPKKAIRLNDYHINWIPFISDNTGNYLAMDLAPLEKGNYGQIINYGSDESNHFVMGNSLTAFLKLINTLLATNDNFISYVKDSHITDALKNFIVPKGELIYPPKN